MNGIILELSALLLSLFCLIYSVVGRRKLYFPLPRKLLAFIKNRHSIFLFLLLTVILSAGASVSGTIGHSVGAKAWLLEFFHSVYYFVHNAVSVSFALYIFDMSGPARKKGWRFYFLFLLPFLIGELLILTNSFTHLCFYVDEDLVYHRGQLVWAFYAVAGLYIVSGLAYFGMHARSISKGDRTATLILITVAVAGVVLQAFWKVLVELFFDSIAFLGFMALLEHDGDASDRNMSNRFRRSVALAVSFTFLVVILLNVSLTFSLISAQANEIGNAQLNIISRDLQDTISGAEADVLHTAISAEQVLDTDPSRAELEAYLYAQRESLGADESFMNVYIAGSDWHIIPGFDAPPEYHATERVWYVGARERPGEVYISEPYMDANFGIMCFTVSTMLSDGETVAAIDLNFNKAQESILRMTGDGDRSALIVTSGGLIAGYTDMSLVGQNAAEKLPEYAELLQRVTSSEEHRSFRVKLGGESCMIFSSETSNGWYLILSVSTGVLYAESYQQVTMITAVMLLMLVVVVVFYMVSTRNRIQTAEALKKNERMIAGLIDKLRESTATILRLSDWRLIEESESPAELVGQMREAGLRLSEEMRNLSSYTELQRVQTEEREAEPARERSVAETSRRLRGSVVLILLVSLVLVSFICFSSAGSWGDLSMAREADHYENELTAWMSQQQNILYMFTDMISAQPELMYDYQFAVRWLDKISSHYPEISACYMANPYNEHTVIMNTGWEPDADFQPENRPWYRDTERSPNGFNISAPYLDAQTGNYCITFSRVVNGGKNEFLGIFGIDFFLDKLIDVLDDSYSSTAYAFLVDEDRTIVNHPNAAYEMSGPASVSVEDTEYAEAYNREGVTLIRDYSGKLVSCLSRQTPYGFTVIVANSWVNLYKNMILIMVLVIFAFALCIGLIILLINRLLRWQEEANRKLVEAADAAVRAGKAKSQFLAQMSHEIRTPINAVLGMNELIINTGRDPEIMEYAANIQSAGHTLLSLINSILDFSKIEDGKMEIINAHYETLSMLDDLVNMVSERAVKKGLELTLDFDPDIPSVLYGDDLRIRQVITNLLTNAVKYTHAGSITFTMRLLKSEGEACELFVAVSDTGIGIRKEDIGKLFESFQRLDEERNRSIEGTGLGIAIVQRLLTMMDSRLEVESEYGKGSTFSFRLMQQVIDREPIGSYEGHRKAVIQKMQSKQSLYAPGAEVLVVDDNDLNLKVARGLLRRSGIEADLADSGAKCLEMTLHRHYDIIFMDHMMPVMDGFKTLSAIRERGVPGEDTAIIALTANAVAGAKNAYLQAGFRDYLTKPIEPEALEQMLARYLPAEKVEWRAADGQEAPAPAESHDPIARLEAAGFNTESGLRRAAGYRDFYLELLQGFLREHDEKAAVLSDSLAAHDLEHYEITVHALKSTARLIGADSLSDLAFELEAAARERDEAAVTAKSEPLLKLYQATVDKIASALSVETDSPKPEPAEGGEITVEELRALLNEALLCLESFEFARCGDLLGEQLDRVFRGQSLRERLSGALTAIDSFEAEDAEEKLKALLAEL